MIRFVSKEIQKFIDFLNEKYSTKEDVMICFIPEEFETNVKEWGFYEENQNKIFIFNGNNDLSNRADKDYQIMGVIAHEYKHFMNERFGLEQDEDECDAFAYKVIEEFTEGKVRENKNE